MELSLGKILLVVLLVLVVFGAGRLPQVMGDLGKGVRKFKEGMNADEKMADKTDKSDKTLPPPDA